MEKNYKNNSSTAIVDQSEMSEILDKIRDIFDIPDQEDVFSDLERIKEEIETIEPLKNELEKAQQMYEELKSKHEKYLSKKSEHNMNDYTQGLINTKNQELEYLNSELNLMRQKYDQIESARWDLNNEKHIIQNQMSEIQRILNDREKEIGRLRQDNQGLQHNVLEYKEAAKKLMMDKKDLESELERLGNQDDLQRSKTVKDIESLKSESNSLVSFILSLQLAHDEEFENLFKNQSYANEFDQAKKHLENQKDIVDTLLKKLQKDLESKTKEVQDYKLYISDLEKQTEDVGNHKSEAIKWKQCYERLTITLKNTKDNYEVESVLADYEKVQNQLQQSKLENTKLSEALKEKESNIVKLKEDIIQREHNIENLQAQIKELKGNSNSESNFVNTQNSQLLLKLEKEIKKLEAENDKLKTELSQNQKSSQDLSEKYKLSVEKSLKQDQLEHIVGQLESDIIKLKDQVSVLKKENAEQKKILNLHDPQELATTISNLKSTLSKRENKIKEIEAEKSVLENLLDEARLEIQNQSDSQSQKSEVATFNDAIEILDSIASKPLGLSSSNKSQEFNAVMKRLLLIKEQTEEPIVTKIINYFKEYLPTDFGDQREKLSKFNDLKALLVDTLGSIRSQFKVSFDEQNDLLNVSTDSKTYRRPYGIKDTYIDISFIFDQFTETYSTLARSRTEKSISALKQDHEEYITQVNNEFFDKLQNDRKTLIEQMRQEKEAEIKIREEKVAKQFENKRKEMYEQFEKLKNEFQDQFSEQSKRFLHVSEEETDKQRQELDKQKEIYEQEVLEKLQKKTNALEGMFQTRKNELEDEYNLKMQKLDFELKSKAETQDYKNKLELETLVSKFETQAQEKIKRIQNEADMKVQDYEEQMKAKTEEMKKLKQEHDKKLKDHKKTMERELKFKSETLERESKSKIEREIQKYKEANEDSEQQIKDFNEKINEEKKKARELIKSNNEKHKAEIKNIKNTHENELIRKKIEHEKETKKAKRDLEIELENVKKEHEVLLAERLLNLKKDLNEKHNQKLKLEKSKNDKELIDKEIEINQKHNSKELELIKKHEIEIDELKQNLTKQHDKLMKAAIDNIKAEFKDKCEQEVSEELQCATERLKKEYQTENYNLKLKLQEINDTQSVASGHQINMDLI